MRQRTYAQSTEIHKGLLSTGEYAVVMLPKLWAADGNSPAAIYAPALSAGALNVFGWFTAFELCKRGIAVVASDLGDTPTVYGGGGLPSALGGTGNGGNGVWGNDAALTKLTAVHDYAVNTLKAKTQVAVMGGSHGGAAAPRWVAGNPTLASCLLMAIGTVDIQDMLTNNRGTNAGWAASIQAAWGLGSGTTLPSTSSGHVTNLPVTGVQAAPSIQCQVRNYYSDTDPYCTPATHTAFQAANTSKITNVSLGSVGHSTSSVPTVEAADWILANS